MRAELANLNHCAVPFFNPFTAEPFLDFIVNATLWRVNNIGNGADCSKMLNKGISNYLNLDVKSMISLNNNENISIYCC